jgi:uncharacterized protein DUF6064
MIELPFTAPEFFGVFRRYNETVWPAQWILYGVAAVVVAKMFQGPRPRSVLVLLALLWVWMGLVYHLTFFAPLNPAARVFGILCIAQAAILLWFARSATARMVTAPSRTAVAGAKVLVAYALLGYPLIGYLLGRRFPETPTFGAPCPTTIFTLGILAWSQPALPWWVVAIPLGWTVVGTSAALQLSVPEDFGLTAAGLFSAVLLVQRFFASSSAEPVAVGG